MEWLNEPANWQRTGDLVTVSVDTGTDFWRETGYGYVRDSGHVYGEVLAGDLDVSVRVRCALGVQYDQAGVMLRADERTWLKTGMEFFEGRPRLSTVLTLGRSSWMVTDLPAGTDDIVLRVSRRGDAVEVRYVLEDGPAELAALAFLPPGREVLAGVMGAAPEGPGFRVTFHDLRITERDWSAPADDATTWPDERPGWAAVEAPGWSPADGEPGWSPAAAGDEAADWPAAAAEDDSSSWPLPAVAEDGPDWIPTEAGEDETDWPVPSAAAEEPGWPAPAAEDAASHAPAAEPAPGEPDPGAPDPARPQAVLPDPGAPDPARPEAVLPDPAGPGPAAAGREPGAEEPAGDAPGPPDPPGREASGRGTRSAAPARSLAEWARGTDRDAAADWDRLAAGAQVGQAERWIAQPDADVANEWPGPPLRTAVRNGRLARDATARPAAGHPADDAQTNPGLPRPGTAEDAVTLPDQTQASAEPDPSAAAGDGTTREGATGDGTPGDGTTPDGATGDRAAALGPADSKPPARESRRGKSKRAAADPPAEPDAADEWISLLTADPVEE